MNLTFGEHATFEERDIAQEQETENIKSKRRQQKELIEEDLSVRKGKKKNTDLLKMLREFYSSIQPSKLWGQYISQFST